MSRILSRMAVAGLLAALAAPGAQAHHSAAMFDFTKTRELKGVVTQFAWTNPHGYLQLDVKTSSGRTQNWSIEFQSVAGMARQGLKPSSFKPGDAVTVVIYPLRNGSTGGDFHSARLADGSEVHSKPPG